MTIYKIRSGRIFNPEGSFNLVPPGCDPHQSTNTQVGGGVRGCNRWQHSPQKHNTTPLSLRSAGTLPSLTSLLPSTARSSFMRLPDNSPGGSESSGGFGSARMNPNAEPDFSEFMWMAEEDLEAFDHKVICEVNQVMMEQSSTLREDEEEFLRRMLEEEEQRDTVYYHQYQQEKISPKNCHQRATVTTPTSYGGSKCI
ncbi:uncharacterized protein Paip2 isoform X3 [Cherax quadricarinatus]|uniref:uncharacterized protein Paip2 isoform X3 n=1 Tax=Cherax quadricarinatus TaxID=27406 RepID=UPI0023791468|nr:uncharacterized protein LOC128697735 isoform X3 [Cherax quadricarinatus]